MNLLARHSLPLLLVFCFLVSPISALAQKYLITKEMTQHLKKAVTWEVIPYEENPLKGWTEEDFEAYMGNTDPAADMSIELNETAPSLESVIAPEHFDAREKWSKCIHKIRKQGHCGSCWAHTSTEVLSDRFCIHSNVNVNLSVQDPVSCDKSNKACGGGGLVEVFLYLRDKGAVTEECFPYTSGSSGKVPICPTKCPTGKAWEKHYCKTGSTKRMTKIEDMKNDMLSGGPAGTHFRLFEDFNYYKSGVYYHKTGAYKVGHYMKVVGWGKESGMDYWICANSFGPQWGEHGYVKFKMSDCGINEYMVSCLPK